MSLEPLLAKVGELDDAGLRDVLSGNICRCTGYASIVEALRLAHGRVTEQATHER
jgi:carbon-monoxide dehydrogenase small subunit